MTFLEKDLENIIWEADNEKLRSKNLFIYGRKFRQLRIGNYGILDLLTVHKRYNYNSDNGIFEPYLDITIYELKKEKVTVSAFLQALNYAKGIKTYLESRSKKLDFKLHISLCAKEVDIHSSFIFLGDMIKEEDKPNKLLNSVSSYSFDYGIDGILFNKKTGYNLTRPGFEIKVDNNDETPF